MKELKIEIGIAEDHSLVRQGIISMLKDYADIKILFEAGNGKELLKALKEYKPAIVLLDIVMPVLGGIESMKIITERYPKVKIIVITAHSENASMVEYVKLGAYSVLDKNCKVNALISAIYRVFDGGMYFGEDILKLLAKYGIFPPGYDNKRELTKRESIALKLICSGTAQSEIADLMGVKLHTVDWYKHQLLQKTNSDDVDGLIAYAKKNQLV